ncbi:putative ribonuclease H1 [Dactylonectria macrodidyma]|uniref:ribonuclease H n=1 Tax=Dactylonectria macrodidyma TaxID=307937 RepID=A0A9P9IMS7_9HYPO|nr:putative ribonuclease H1 [Dactylonectria macrodidyma]
MPRGWYLAQGLIPLGYSSSDDEEGPCELPNGKLVCGPHGLVRCGRCCSDYSFMDDVLGEDRGDFDDDEHDDENYDDEDYDDEDHDDEDHDLAPDAASSAIHDCSLGPEAVKGTGLVFPSKFTPPANPLQPMELFCSRVRFMNLLRCTSPNDSSKLLIMTDGACLNNGQANPKAGWAFFQGMTLEGQPLVVSGRLEKKGPWGDDGIQSSNRAELRAVIAALRFRYWPGEGFRTVIIATDSEYVVEGSTQWAKNWVRNNWMTKGKKGNGNRSTPVKNQDLWEMLLGECEKAHSNGLAIQFWKIPREWNTLADEGAKEGAAVEEAPVEMIECMGLAI